jgi:hypothetical protein
MLFAIGFVVKITTIYGWTSADLIDTMGKLTSSDRAQPMRECVVDFECVLVAKSQERHSSLTIYVQS